MARAIKTACNCCVFHRGNCTIGITGTSQKKCSNYLPLCISCPYPDTFCSTCPLRPQNDQKSEIHRDTELGNHMYGCVWDSSSLHKELVNKKTTN